MSGRPVAPMLASVLAIALVACATGTPGDAGAPPSDAGTGEPRLAPAPSPDCAPSFPEPAIAPSEWMSPVTHAASGEAVLEGSSVEVMQDASGRRVIPLATTISRTGFSCWRITADLTSGDGARFETPPFQALSEAEGSTLVFHVRAGDLHDEVVTLYVTVQGNATEYYRWSRSVRLVGP